MPRLNLGSDWTTGTAALVFHGLTSSAMQVTRHLTVLSAATIFALSPPLSPPRGVKSPRAPLDTRSSNAGISRFYRRRRFLALSPPLSPPRGATSPRAPLDTRSSDFGISWVYEDHFKAEMRGFPTSHLRASSDAVECNRGQRQVGPQPRVPLHGRVHHSTAVRISSKSKNGPRGIRTRDLGKQNPDPDPDTAVTRIALRGLGARLIINHASSTADAAGPANANGSTTAASSVNVADTAASANHAVRRTAVFGTVPLPVSLAKLGISTASRQLSEVRHVPASRQLSEVRHQHRFPSA